LPNLNILILWCRRSFLIVLILMLSSPRFIAADFVGFSEICLENLLVWENLLLPTTSNTSQAKKSYLASQWIPHVVAYSLEGEWLEQIAYR
jgi:hypothetical protein